MFLFPGVVWYASQRYHPGRVIFACLCSVYSAPLWKYIQSRTGFSFPCSSVFFKACALFIASALSCVASSMCGGGVVLA